jgi:hypothetical protein
MALSIMVGLLLTYAPKEQSETFLAGFLSGPGHQPFF